MTADLIGVFPRGAYGSRRRLFRALGAAFGVTIAGREPGEWADLDAAIVLGDRSTARAARRHGISVFEAFKAPDETIDTDGAVVFARSEALPAVLRGCSMRDHQCAGGALPGVEIGDVLATVDGRAVWVREERDPAIHHYVTTAPREIELRERLRALLRPGDFLGLLPLVHFLREVSDDGRFSPPPLRACAIVDDPNMHWTSYGYLRFRPLAAHAQRYGYHVALATVPLDARVAHPRSVSVVRDSAELSLLVHGNDHVKRELERPTSLAEALALASQASQRVRSFERRHGITVDRVMVPPHDDYLDHIAAHTPSRHSRSGPISPDRGACSETVMAALALVGFDAVTYYGPAPSSARDETIDALVGWSPADVFLGGGLPGIHRAPMTASQDELALRAFLGQPLVVFGHHAMFAEGFDVLGDVADRVNALGPVEWCSMARVASTNVATAVDGGRLRVRMYARRTYLVVPPGTESVRVEIPPPIRSARIPVRIDVLLASRHGRVTMTANTEEDVPLSTTVSAIAITVGRRISTDFERVPAPHPRVWPLLRRCLVEGRDRMQPLIDRRGGPTGAPPQ